MFACNICWKLTSLDTCFWLNVFSFIFMTGTQGIQSRNKHAQECNKSSKFYILDDPESILNTVKMCARLPWLLDSALHSLHIPCFQSWHFGPQEVMRKTVRETLRPPNEHGVWKGPGQSWQFDAGRKIAPHRGLERWKEKCVITFFFSSSPSTHTI